MIAGLKLNVNEDSFLALLDDNLEIIQVGTNEEIVDNLPEDVKILAVNAPLEKVKGLTDKEEELMEEGYQFTPSTHNVDLNRRAVHLQQMLFEKGREIEVIRFDPMITSKELAIEGDSALESYGIDTSEIKSAGAFDAVLGAITARFYQQEQCRDLGIQIPENINQNT